MNPDSLFEIDVLLSKSSLFFSFEKFSFATSCVVLRPYCLRETEVSPSVILTLICLPTPRAQLVISNLSTSLPHVWESSWRARQTKVLEQH